MLEYYLLLRSVQKTKPQLRRCLKRCRHCRIFFFTDPRNAGRKDMRGVGRKDLGCPFGCRKAHRQRESTRRSVAYNRTKEGKKRKQVHNQRRRKTPPKVTTPELTKCPLAPPLIEHVRLVVSLIEDRQITLHQILQLVEKVLRQHRMARMRRIDQIMDYLNKRPP